MADETTIERITVTPASASEQVRKGSILVRNNKCFRIRDVRINGTQAEIEATEIDAQGRERRAAVRA